MPSVPRSILTCKISSVLSIPATDEHHTALFLLLSSSSLNSLSSLSLIFTRRSPPIEDAAPSRAPSVTPSPCRPGPPPRRPSSSFKPAADRPRPPPPHLHRLAEAPPATRATGRPSLVRFCLEDLLVPNQDAMVGLLCSNRRRARSRPPQSSPTSPASSPWSPAPCRHPR